MVYSTRIFECNYSEVNDFIRRKRVTGKSLRTLNEYSRFLKKFFERVVNKGPRDVSEDDIEDYVIELQDKGLAQNSQRKYLDTLSSFYQFLVSSPKYNIQYNPIKSIAVDMSYEKKERPLFATWDNARKLIFFIRDPRDRCVCVILLKTGMRISEALNLRMQDIDFEKEWIYIKKRKGGKEGYVPIDEEVVRAVKRYLLMRPRVDSDYLFISLRGAMLSRVQIGRRIKEYAVKLGIAEDSRDFHKKFTPHIFRTIFTTEMRNRRMREDILKRIRGDSLRDVMDLYTNVTREQIKEEYDNCIPKLGI